MPNSKKGTERKSVVTSAESLCSKQFKGNSSFYNWTPTVNNIKQIEYVRTLECKYEELQSDYLNLNTQFARLQFRLRQLMEAQPMERNDLVKNLERIAFEGVDAYSQCKPEELPPIERDNQKMGNIAKKQSDMVCYLRSLLGDLESESDCVMLEYNNDPKWESEQKKKCPPIDGDMMSPSLQTTKDLKSATPSTKSMQSTKSGKVSK
ncbi:uncharacterized protein LOC142233861 [Haematobia irritans]|uniref:uncharacterized protein LOC142233861 n=1 Tax=Haematobia irritans TaxID=7368 RepID=UPI003F5052A2